MFDLLDSVEEAVIVIGRLNWAGYVLVFFNVPEVQGSVVLVMLEFRNDGSLQKSSDEE